jgi:uncharacterized protein
MRKIGGILGRSPFGPTHEHLLKVIDCVNALAPLVDAAVKGDKDSTERVAHDVHRLEEEADEIKSAIRIQYTTSFFASVSRSELMALVKAQDDVADECDRLAFELSVRRTRFPEHIISPFVDLISRLVSMARPLSESSRILDEASGGITADVVSKVSPLLDELRKAISEIDPLFEALLRQLFARETESNPLDVMYVMHLAGHGDKIAKKTENVTDVLTRLVEETKQ